MERIREPMDKNRIQGGAEQGERARSGEAVVVKAQAATRLDYAEQRLVC